jgi:maltose alpha-D-glucosyltransferase/alpha-amylase
VERVPDGAALLAALDRIGATLPAYLGERRWFGGKGRPVEGVRLVDGAALPGVAAPAALALIEVRFADGGSDLYALPLAAGRRAEVETLPGPPVALACLATPVGEWLLYDGLDSPAVGATLFRLLEDAARVDARTGSFVFDRTPILSQATGGVRPAPLAVIRRVGGEQSNTSVVLDDRLVLKVFRRLSPGENPDLEVSRFLTLRARFPHAPQLAGFATWAAGDGERSLAVLTTFVPNAGDGWTWTLAALRTLFAAVRGQRVPEPAGDAHAAVASRAGAYLAGVRRLGQVTGELHAALASDPDDPAFAPEPVSGADLAAWAAAVDTQIADALAGLRAPSARWSPGLRADIERVIAAAEIVRARPARMLAALADAPLWKIRIHGDYHLGQVLRRPGEPPDFVVTDFEGEPARPLAARRAKHSPLRDVAGMLRSLAYAGHAALREVTGESAPAPELEGWRVAWEEAAADAFQAGYRAATVERGAVVVPAAPEVTAALLSLFSLEKAAYELRYELDNRPAWLPIPLAAFSRELAA